MWGQQSLIVGGGWGFRKQFTPLYNVKWNSLKQKWLVIKRLYPGVFHFQRCTRRGGGTWIIWNFWGGIPTTAIQVFWLFYLNILNSIFHLEPPCVNPSSHISNYVIPPTAALQIISFHLVIPTYISCCSSFLCYKHLLVTPWTVFSTSPLLLGLGGTTISCILTAISSTLILFPISRSLLSLGYRQLFHLVGHRGQVSLGCQGNIAANLEMFLL